MKQEINKRQYHRTSSISGCNECNWEGVSAREARSHCKETGHKTWNESNIVVYYEQNNKKTSIRGV